MKRQAKLKNHKPSRAPSRQSKNHSVPLLTALTEEKVREIVAEDREVSLTVLMAALAVAVREGRIDRNELAVANFNCWAKIAMDPNSSLYAVLRAKGPTDAAPRASAWQPIETAPKDGSFIIVSAGVARNPGGSDMCIARYDQGSWVPQYSATGAYCGAKWWMPLPGVPE